MIGKNSIWNRRAQLRAAARFWRFMAWAFLVQTACGLGLAAFWPGAVWIGLAALALTGVCRAQLAWVLRKLEDIT